MHVIMGGTGHVGSATAAALLARGQGVTVITRDAVHAAEWKARGASIAQADVDDVDALRAALRLGRRAFVLNPPAAVSTDTDAVERHTVACILAALEGSALEKVVAESTGGARRGERLGDLSVLWELEQGLQRGRTPSAINRAAFYMSNWDSLLEPARATGKLQTLFDADLPIPMVAPQDLGDIAADRLLSGLDDVGVKYVEGPARYTPRDVARAFAAALNRPVEVDVIPRQRWIDNYRQLGFSQAAAEAYARMTAASLDGGFDMPRDALRGRTALETYVDALVARPPSSVQR